MVQSATSVIAPPEEVVVSSKRVACDGGNGHTGAVLGHPLVYLDMGEDDFVECGYCDRRFVLSADAHSESEYLDPAARPPEAH
ncbi:hypothetical protein KOAAANKH_00310 [Brevundimonas sp. NIBR10]|jgi:uncharacterized Zn-finger protein|uniref:zinc-finger domain-containing protein n=1 Tax=unclassified Brevundimonas TaxID=2622653 RepID=UPI0022F19AA6|nr:zinc-finger domain-containing protein [Brevundimonas sp. NIBR10]WGM45447.1 hypothetical protein KOAAANKH_00310 [Brevundimonas sp. NIBR10]